jgi:thioredoxin reductase
METDWDVIVVGGGAAGLSAALVLGRARQRTLVVDAGRQSNLAAHHIGGFLGQNERPAAEFYADARAEVLAHPTVEIREGEVIGGDHVEGGFVLRLADGTQASTRRVVLASGMDYRPPTTPGIAERWGRSVFHCPFCHGWEVRDRPLAVLDGGATGTMRALLLREWSDDVTLLTDGGDGPTDDERATLAAAGVEVDERPVASVDGPGVELEVVTFADGSTRPVRGLLVPAPLHQRSDLAAQLGAEAAPASPQAFDALEIDAMQATSGSGVFAAGDIANPMPSVAAAVAMGQKVAAMVVHSLLVEKHDLTPAA